VLQQLDEKEGIVVQELEAGRIEETRKGIPLYTQRRFDVYPDVSEGGKFKE
jgi:predicted amidohydrolase